MTEQYQVRFVQIPRWLALVAGALAIAFAVALFLLPERIERDRRS